MDIRGMHLKVFLNSIPSDLLPQIDWVRIATEIELNYTFDAFVILHGTDTMAYTSSALSFLLEDLGKTVVTALSILSSPLYSVIFSQRY